MHLFAFCAAILVQDRDQKIHTGMVNGEVDLQDALDVITNIIGETTGVGKG